MALIQAQPEFLFIPDLDPANNKTTFKQPPANLPCLHYTKIKIFSLDPNWPLKIKINGEALPKDVLAFDNAIRFTHYMQINLYMFIWITLFRPINRFIKVRHARNSEQLLEYREEYAVELLGYCLKWMIGGGIKPTRDRKDIKLSNLTDDDFRKATKSFLTVTKLARVQMINNLNAMVISLSQLSPYHIWLHDMLTMYMEIKHWLPHLIVSMVIPVVVVICVLWWLIKVLLK